MGAGIFICGCNGCGKSMLGRELAKRLNYTFMDVEDYYFPEKSGDYRYGVSLSQEEVDRRIAEDIRRCDHFILTAVKARFPEEIQTHIRCTVMISVPQQIRMQRVRDRSFVRFGERILPGGDLYEKEEQFFTVAENRTDREIEASLETLDCRVICVDGTRPVAENAEWLAEELKAVFL